jgi:flavorubredoxin
MMEIVKPGLRIKNTPDEKGLDECRKLGKNIANQIS